jgi:hypothetical protein
MAASNPRLIAINFYDGPTEGFVSSVDDGFAYFFKVAAWDEGQDRRLYVLGDVPRSTYQELVEILMSQQQGAFSPVWVPSWKFVDPEVESRVNNIVEMGRSSLRAPAMLVLSESLLEAWERVMPNEAQLARLEELLQGDWPGSLNDWLGMRPST